MRGLPLQRIFLLAFGLRLLAALILQLGGFYEGGISRDSIKYHITGIGIAADYAYGTIDWKQWVDNGWYQFVGVVYWIFGASVWYILLINAFLGSLAAVVTTRLAYNVYGHWHVAVFSGLLVAVFPSFVYYSALLLKDPASLLSMCLFVNSLVMMRKSIGFAAPLTCILCLLVFLSLRSYLFIIGFFLALACLAPIWRRDRFAVASLVILVSLYAAVCWLLGYGFMGIEFIKTIPYFDLDYLNDTRNEMNKGRGAMGVGSWGDNLMQDISNMVTAFYYAMFSVNPLDIRSGRQLMALPEFLFVLACVIPLVKGLSVSMRHFRSTAIPLIIVGFGLLVLYGSATTNAGAMFRWRIQAFPFLFILMSVGLLYAKTNPIKGFMLRFSRRVAS